MTHIHLPTETVSKAINYNYTTYYAGNGAPVNKRISITPKGGRYLLWFTDGFKMEVDGNYELIRKDTP